MDHIQFISEEIDLSEHLGTVYVCVMNENDPCQALLANKVPNTHEILTFRSKK